MFNQRKYFQSWVWIKDLQKVNPRFGQLNGKLGQIIGYDDIKNRCQVFVPNLDSNGFDKDYLTNFILVKQDDKKIRKLFAEFTTNAFIKSLVEIKDENLKEYDGILVECQHVPPGKEVFRYGRNTP